MYGPGWHIYGHVATYCIRDFNVHIGTSAVKENRNNLGIRSEEGHDININIACNSLNVNRARWNKLGEMTHSVEQRLLVELSEGYK